jgi:peptidoglycan/LPS O-acetylase OafA/YrhL
VIDRPEGFRPDIEGLRAVAVLLVMVYHAGLPLLPHGYLGVDVFFVISGYLITSLLLRELALTGGVSWPRFLGRRIRRLLPAAVLVLGFVAVVTSVLVPGRRGREIGGDVAGAAVYGVNWVLAGRSVDYLAADARPSPVQHYWSLAIEEQFYLVWPLCLIALATIVRLVRRSPDGNRQGPSLRVIALLLAAIGVPSLAYSVWHTATVPAHAYFATTTRVWELAVGAGLAVWTAGREPAGRRLSGFVGWLGLAVIVGAAAFLPAEVAWPGATALLPTLATAAVLWSGWERAGSGPVRLLGLAPLVWVGALSYSLYLWHWPLAVFAGEVWGRGLPVALAVLASALPAWASYRFLEQPIHHSRRLAARTRPTLALGAALSLGGVALGLPLVLAPSPFQTVPASGQVPPVERLGAAVLASPPSADPSDYAVDAWDWLTPDPEHAGQDRPSADVDRCQVDERSEEPVRCEFGTASDTTIALVGDSKAMQWLPALERLAAAHHWRIVTYGKSSCAFSTGGAVLGAKPYPSCDHWNARVLRSLLAQRPDAVVTSSHAERAWDGRAATREALPQRLAAQWRSLQEAGIPVAVIADSPSSPDDLDDCMSRHPSELTTCAFDRTEAVAHSGRPAQLGALGSAPRTTFIDLTPWICPVPRCPVAIGHVAIHRAGDHITATYAATLAGHVEPALADLLARGA